MYADRVEAGQLLATAINAASVADPTESIVLGLPRGGVPVAAEVARLLGSPLDVLVVRKVGAPDEPEFALGAVGEDGVVILDAALAHRLGVTDEDVSSLVEEQQREVDRRTRLLRERFPRLALDNKTAIIVDDGLATGSTAAAAIHVARGHGATRVVVASPVGSPHAIKRLAALSDAVICPQQPEWFDAVGYYYRDFRQVADEEVVTELERVRGMR